MPPTLTALLCIYFFFNTLQIYLEDQFNCEGIQIPYFVNSKSRGHILKQSTQVRFASFFSVGFITAIVVSSPERRLEKRTFVQSGDWNEKPSLLEISRNVKGHISRLKIFRYVSRNLEIFISRKEMDK